MTKFEQLLDLAEKENIIVKFVDEIPEYRSEALYVARHGILLLNSLMKSQNIVLKLYMLLDMVSA